ncbi:hypothetical protein TRV_03146 [Trichophyton verrucosum HKI 0517]|uniref:AB hydrolase-1 domain-containing protein n=1 Tax=Trichophyton verrucosum (strain HKI 0517) TaxID=663202 RepID=D4D7R2_TRIVH|nr:uncharacterized protein TRV_03146 [Trichophyton verrucosum HKI 0517]EFE42105.1 hypothetical protein TRV_03146 [Trichophyton verrucosum HKI 0517]
MDHHFSYFYFYFYIFIFIFTYSTASSTACLQLRLQLRLLFYCYVGPLHCLLAVHPRPPRNALTSPVKKKQSRVEIQKNKSDRLVSVARPSAVKLSSSRIPALPLIAAARSPRPPLLLHHHQPATASTSASTSSASASASIVKSLPASTLSAPRSQTPFDSSAAPSRPDGWSDAAMASPQAASTASPAAEQPAQAKQPSSFFPLGYKEGFSQWWTCMPAATAEHSVLSFIPYLQQVPTHKQTGKEPSVPDGQAADSLTAADTSQEAQVSANSIDDPYGPRRWRSSMVQLSGDNRALNEFSVERVGEKVENNLVVLHGYGAGLGFFYKNFESLSRAKGWQLYALDLLGMGRSTRPPFKIHAKERDQAVTEAEDWFIDALEEWRVKRKIERFTLMGHSLGGYMAVAYALKYPGRLNKLILASPVGIPKDPRAVDAELTEPSESTLSAEFTESQDATTGNASNNNNNNNNNNSLAARTPPLLRPLPKWLTYLWDSNVSPFSFVRWSGPLGPRLVSGWTSRRFSHLPQPESKALHDYAYSIFRMRGSGEYALSYILAPGAYARKPSSIESTAWAAN